VPKVLDCQAQVFTAIRLSERRIYFELCGNLGLQNVSLGPCVTAANKDQCGHFKSNVSCLTILHQKFMDFGTWEIMANHAKRQNSRPAWISWICDFRVARVIWASKQICL